MFRRLRRILLILMASLLGLVLITFLAGTVLLRGSRPRLEGELELEGLSGPVTVTRDALGVPACDVREWSFDGLTYDEVRTENREPPRQDIAGSNGQVAYRLVRNFSFECIDGVYGLLTGGCVAADPDFRSGWLPYRHAVTWEVLAERPDHLLPPWDDDWNEFVLKAVERTMEFPVYQDRDLSTYTWGSHNTVVVAHPFTQLVPFLSRWLAAPPQAQPGDSFMPRVQHRRSGASERMVVSPGREEDGILHMPGGQSGHPLSPFFLKGHEDWVAGAATPLLPGPAEFRLDLVP